MLSQNEREQLASDFALGTLDTDEHQRVTLLRESDADLDALITDWEYRLAPLLENYPEATPATDLFDRIEARLDQAQAGESVDELAILRKSVSRWRRTAAVGFAAAVGLMALVLVRAPLFVQPASPFVAVFQQDDQQPAFLMTVDMSTRRLKVQAVTASALDNQTYQLWIKADPLGPQPQSLGLLNALDGATLKDLNDFDAELLKTATFGISVEPPGGSPTGVPTGPAIHGYLYPASDEI